jgi:uncharacterized phage protein gp47/JayE
MSTNDDLSEFLPLFAEETEATILARMAAWANEGLDPSADVDRWVDTREGGHWSTAVTPGARELARIYDLMGTIPPMAAMVVWAWDTYLDDIAATYNLLRLVATPAAGVETFTGDPGTVIGPGTTVAAQQLAPGDPAPTFAVVDGGTIPLGGTVDLEIVATETGTAGSVAAGAVTEQVTPLGSVTLVNAAAIVGGTDLEDDDHLRGRIIVALAPGSGANERFYLTQAGNYPGVVSAFVVAAWAGPTTVLVVVLGVGGQPTSAATVAGLQAQLDPVPGKAKGTAPAGAVVTVVTGSQVTVAIVGALALEEGFSIDGTGGTIAVGPPITADMAAYLAGVGPGDEVVFEQISGIMARTTGVHDVVSLTLNGGNANMGLSLLPAQVPLLLPLALTSA